MFRDDEEVTARTPAGPAERTTVPSAGPGEKRLTLLVVCSALFLALLDSTVISLALPTVQRDLNAGVEGLQWIVDGYILLYAALLLTGGTLGDRFGRRRVFLGGMAVFLAGSLLCALSGSVATLIAGRAVQGVGAAAVTPQTLAILAQVFPGERERARAFGTWSAVSGLALLLGPVAGGALAELFGWQSVFLLNLPIGLVALAAGRRLPAATAVRTPRPLDPVGQLLAFASLAPLTYGLVEGPRSGWHSMPVVAALAVAVASAGALLVFERRTAHPMLRLDLFRIRTFSGATAVTFLVACGLNAGFLLLSLMLQVLGGADASVAGLRLLPTMAAIVVAAAVAGRVSARFGPRPLVLVGTATAGISLISLGALAVGERYVLWWPLLVLMGLGIGMVMSPNNAALVGSAPSDASGQAASMGAASQQVGALLGVASLGLFLTGAVLGRAGSGGNGGEDPSAGAAPDGLAAALESGLLAAGTCYLLAAVVAALLIRTNRQD
ncbi:MFS transporter [Streptomyces sp. TR06-5]|uniref:MFS transporter n=1 Tax=unclassified Streptomyces TaxID=2593676 RepID=UPI0039A122F2